MNTSEYLPEDILDFLRSYSFKDKEKIYTNGADLIPLYRVVQALEYYYGYKKMKTPITEAIPVEWMEVWLAEHEAWDFRTTFIEMINDWRNGETE